MISILQDPGILNKAFGVNAFSLTGTEENGKYVLRIVDNEDDSLITDIRQIPNKNLNALFDIQNVLQTYIEPSKIGFENIVDIDVTTEEWLSYKAEYGFEDITGTYTEAGVSEDFLVFGAKKEYYELLVDEDKYSGSEDQGLTLTDKQRIIANNLPFRPASIEAADEVYTHIVYGDDFYTLSFYNNTIVKVKFSFYNANGNLISVDSLLTEVTAPFITVGVGPRNIDRPEMTKYYFIEIYSDLESVRGSYKAHFFEIADNDCNDFDPIQFSWLNSYGFRDYYTFKKRNVRSDNVERNIFKKSLIDYNAETVNIIPGDRGDKIYSQRIETTYRAATDFLLDVEDEFLNNMILSPDVRVRVAERLYELSPSTQRFIWNLNTTKWVNELRVWNFNGSIVEKDTLSSYFEPVVLLTNEYTQRRFRTDRLFQLEVEFKMANNKKSLRG